MTAPAMLEVEAVEADELPVSAEEGERAGAGAGAIG